MKRNLKMAALILLVAFAAIQFYQPKLNRDGGKAYPTDFMRRYDVPGSIQDMLRASCYDCHSNNTNYAWYDYIQPARFLVESHIKEAKDELNFNEWGNYSQRKQDRLLSSIKKQIERKQMPLPSYSYMRKDAALGDSDIKKISDWLESIL